MTALILTVGILGPAAPLPKKPPSPPSWSALAGAEWHGEWNGQPCLLALTKSGVFFFMWDDKETKIWEGTWHVEAGKLYLRELVEGGGGSFVEYRFGGMMPRLQAMPGPADPTPFPVTLIISRRERVR